MISNITLIDGFCLEFSGKGVFKGHVFPNEKLLGFLKFKDNQENPLVITFIPLILYINVKDNSDHPHVVIGSHHYYITSEDSFIDSEGTLECIFDRNGLEDLPIYKLAVNCHFTT